MQFQSILTSIALTVILFLSAQATSLAQSLSKARLTKDQVILDMKEAYDKKKSQKLTTLLPTAQGHVLEPWAAYWELRTRLESASNVEIRKFLKQYAGSYQEDRLRNDWLHLLGQVGDWKNFSTELPLFRMGDDTEIKCYALMVSYQRDKTPVSESIKELWLGLLDSDQGCAAAAEQQFKAGHIKSKFIWQRARLGMENNRRQVAQQALEILNTKLTRTAQSIYAQPKNYLAKNFKTQSDQDRELASLAIIRLATIDPDMAAKELQKMNWRKQLTREQHSWLWGVIGKRSSMRLSDKAMNYFKKGELGEMHTNHLEWRVRAALRAGEWTEVLTTTKVMPGNLAKESAWVYWRATAMMKTSSDLGQRTKAMSMLEDIAGPLGFYQQLAQEDLGRPIQLPAIPGDLLPQEKIKAQEEVGLRRALYAIQIGLRSDGVKEWNYTTSLHSPGGMPDRELLAAADFACQNLIWDRCINTSERTKKQVSISQRFPMPFQKQVHTQAQKIGLDTAYVYGLIRQESRFITNARSGVGASGLMQIMPRTATWTAKKIGLTKFNPSQLVDQDVNIKIGTAYLKLVLDDFSGSMPLATAAYNAGPKRARNWRGDKSDPTLNAAIWAENIPFSETRDYVKKVLSNTTTYAMILLRQPQSLKARLGQVGPNTGLNNANSNELP